MARRIAAASALLVFAVSILLGLEAQNTFTTTLTRALQGMAVAFIVGWLIGVMVERMVQENLAPAEKNKNSSEKSSPDGR